MATRAVNAGEQHGTQRDTGERPVVIRMSDDLHEQLKARAAAEERSMAQIMRRALRHYVEAVPAP